MFRTLVIILALCALVGLLVHLVFVSIDHAINRAIVTAFDEVDRL